MEEKKTLLLSKLNIKDYKSDLELVLETKEFDDEVKSLILSIFYKFDNFYKDYATVKKSVISKNDILEKYIELVKTKCKKIQLMKPQKVIDNKKYYVDKKNGEIKCIPNEIILAYAIYELEEKDNLDKHYLLYDFTKICFEIILNKGRTIDSIEVIRDFNGWSWNIQIDNEENVLHNLIFQNLVILLGNEFIYENLGKKNIMDFIEIQLKNEYGKNGSNFFEDLIEICVLLYNNQSEENHSKCLKYKNNLISKKNMLSTRKEHVQGTNEKSSNISRQIRKIDEILNDIKLLREEYAKALNEKKKKYFCISDFVDDLEEEKKELLKRIKFNNKILSEEKYLENHDDFKDSIKIYDEITEENIIVNIENKIKNLQISFLKCITNKVKNVDNKKDLLNLCIQVRYYCNLLIKKGVSVISYNKIDKNVNECINSIIKKMIELKMVETGFSSDNLNHDLIYFIFKTKIITLETINIKISFKQYNKIEVSYYDAKTLESKEIYDIPIEEEIVNKKDRKIKLIKIGG